MPAPRHNASTPAGFSRPCCFDASLCRLAVPLRFAARARRGDVSACIVCDRMAASASASRPACSDPRPGRLLDASSLFRRRSRAARQTPCAAVSPPGGRHRVARRRLEWSVSRASALARSSGDGEWPEPQGGILGGAAMAESLKRSVRSSSSPRSLSVVCGLRVRLVRTRGAWFWPLASAAKSLRSSMLTRIRSRRAASGHRPAVNRRLRARRVCPRR